MTAGMSLIGTFVPHTTAEPLDAIDFLEQYVQEMDLSLAAQLPEAAAPRNHDEQIAVAVASCANRAVIGLAYAMFISHGHVDQRLKELSLQMIQRELSSAALSEWCESDERAKALSITAERLNKMPTVPA